MGGERIRLTIEVRISGKYGWVCHEGFIMTIPDFTFRALDKTFSVPKYLDCIFFPSHMGLDTNWYNFPVVCSTCPQRNLLLVWFICLNIPLFSTLYLTTLQGNILYSRQMSSSNHDPFWQTASQNLLCFFVITILIWLPTFCTDMQQLLCFPISCEFKCLAIDWIANCTALVSIIKFGLKDIRICFYSYALVTKATNLSHF